LLYFPIRKGFEILFVFLHIVARHGVILSRQVLSLFFLKNSPVSGILLVSTLTKVPIGITSNIRRARIEKGPPPYLGSGQRSFFFGQSSLVRSPPVRNEGKGSGSRRQDDARAQYALQGLFEEKGVDGYCLFLKGGAGPNSVSVGRIIVALRKSVDVLDTSQESEIYLLAVAEVFALLNRYDAAIECCRACILRAEILVCIQVTLMSLLVTDPIPMVGLLSPHHCCC
jgi:hypothetical protein